MSSSLYTNNYKEIQQTTKLHKLQANKTLQN